jgi:Flp pilus assembly pilin Flp
MARITNNESGQVLIEYVLLLFLVLMMVGIIGYSLRTTVFKLWSGYTNLISAPCPGCEPTQKVNP